MRVIGLIFLFLLLLACFGRTTVQSPSGGDVIVYTDENDDDPRLLAVMVNADLPEAVIEALAAQSPGFLADIHAVLEGGRHLRELVDKQHALSSGFSPPDRVVLEDGVYRVTREGMTLNRAAEVSLGEMAAAARADGVILTVASAYRSFAYQAEVNARLVSQMGQEAADRVSARPGHSQHQTGLVVDFAPIDNAFAQSPAGLWVAANASRFGWSLSYPDGYEAITGYSWESWHYRYVGRELAVFIDRYFGGIQHYALRFLHEWELYQ